MMGLWFLLVIVVYRLAHGENIHDLALSTFCDLDVNIRVGDVVRWTNPTSKTLYLMGEGRRMELNVTIPPKRKYPY